MPDLSQDASVEANPKRKLTDWWKEASGVVTAIIGIATWGTSYYANKINKPISGIALEYRAKENGDKNDPKEITILRYEVLNAGYSKIEKRVELIVDFDEASEPDGVERKFSTGPQVRTYGAGAKGRSWSVEAGTTTLSLTPRVGDELSELGPNARFGVELVYRGKDDWSPKGVSIQQTGGDPIVITNTKPDWRAQQVSFIGFSIGGMLFGVGLGTVLYGLWLKLKTEYEAEHYQRLCGIVGGTIRDVIGDIEAAKATDELNDQAPSPKTAVQQQKPAAIAILEKQKNTKGG